MATIYSTNKQVVRDLVTGTRYDKSPLSNDQIDFRMDYLQMLRRFHPFASRNCPRTLNHIHMYVENYKKKHNKLYNQII